LGSDVGAISSGIRNHLLVCAILSYLLVIVIVSTYHHTIKVKSKSTNLSLLFCSLFIADKLQSHSYVYSQHFAKFSAVEFSCAWFALG